MDKLLHCEVCKKTYTSRSNLHAHIRKIHPDKVDVIRLKKAYNHKCITCGMKFHSKHHLKSHELQVHPAVTSEKFKMINHCPLCQYILPRSKVIDHIESSHNITIEKETFNLGTINEFESWKNNIEKTTKASFIKGSATYFGRNFNKTVFSCHRSGTFQTLGKGKRLLKVQGTNKINAYCPAEIKLIQRGEQFEIQFIKTHLGHENSLVHLLLSKKEKEEIAVKIAAKIPFNAILEEIKHNIDINNMNRIDIVTRRDLYNIEEQYNLKSPALRHKSDDESVEAWVNEVKESGCVGFNYQIMDHQYSKEQEIQGSSSVTENLINQSDLPEDDSYVLEKHKLASDLQHLLQKCTSLPHVRLFQETIRPLAPTMEAMELELKEYINKKKAEKI